MPYELTACWEIQDCVPVVRVVATGKLLSTISLVQNILSQSLEVVEMGAKNGAPETAKVRVLGVVDLSDTPRVHPCADRFTVELDFLL